ncbi:hypothetical protein [Nostoc sp. MG11]|uniref:hypothetical protein n=1 Tax=Nostoc sp. MG11 TaxID=2721166 RepID=UPI001868315D|nr:hypothetical protein [Nostoc sp. MG11]
MKIYKKLGLLAVLTGCTLSCFNTGVIASEVNATNIIKSKSQEPIQQISQTPVDSQYPIPVPADAAIIGSDGSWAIKKTINRPVIMPTGDIVEPGGIIRLREGIKLQIIFQGTQPIGYQLFDYDGRKLESGEVLKAPNGETIQQPSY